MTESEKKASSSVNKSEKGSLLDIDIGDDFFGSWKPMSMAGDGMDFDFETTTKGKKKDFKFDKMDMDFSLDADFDKLSSFKTDMSDLDISSPIKKSGKSTEKSKEASSGGEHQAKRDDFAFSFDFNEFADLDFGSTKKKTDEKCDKSKDKEGCSNTSGSAGSREVLAKDVDDDISSKNPISKGDSQMDDSKDSGPRNEEDNLKSVTYESSNAEEQEIQTTISSEKMISSGFEEPTQESHSSEERSLDNVSGPQEEESGIGAEQNGDVRHVVELVPNKSSSSENLSSDINLQSQKVEMCKERDDDLRIGHKNGDMTTKGDSHLKSSMTPGKENLAHGETVDKRNADFVSKLPMSSIDSGTKTDELVSEKERGNIPTQSTHLKIQNRSEFKKPQASVSFTKLIPVGNKRLSTLPNDPALGKREFGTKNVEPSSKFSGISRPLPNILNRDIPGQSKNTETGHANVRDNTRECSNDDNIKSKNEPKSTTVAHDIGPTKEELASRGRDQNTVHSNPIRSDIHSSTSVKQLTKDLSKNSLNPGLQATNMKSTYNMGKIVIEKIQKSPTKSEMKASEVSSPRISRATEPKLKSLNSLLLKGSPSMRNKEKGPEPQGKMVFKRNPSVDIKNQTTPSTPTLKRKTFEASAESPRSTPLKRLSPSPFSKNVSPSSEKAIDKQMRNHADVAHEKSPRVDASLLEINIYSTTENDALYEQAEACSKELDNICNMLKKKHEKAKDVLARAVVNNNNLLMLNHPIYQDKIHMIQKFAASLSLN